MPTYHYHCETCGEAFELFQGMSSSPVQNCPKCGKPCTRQMGAGSGMIVKGGGATFPKGDMKPPSGAPGCGSGGCCNCSMAG